MGASVKFTPLTFEQIVESRRQQGKTKAQEYEEFYSDLQKMLRSKDPEDMRAVAQANAELDFLNTNRSRDQDSAEQKAKHAELLTRGVPSSQVNHDPALSDISVQYANEAYIGTELMPIVEVPTKGAKYFLYNQRDRFAYPDDLLGPDGEARELSEQRSEANIAAETYGYQNRVNAETLQEQATPLNEMVDMVQAINEGLAFKEEKRIATIVTDTANYATSNKTTVAAGAKWDNDGGNPVAIWKAAISALWTGRGATEIVGWMGRAVFDALCQHAGILELFKYSGKEGLATPEMIAMMLGMDRLLIGSAREDTANEGQASATYGRIWGNYAGVMRVAKTRTIRNASFGYTFRVAGDPVTSEWFEPKKGKAGAFLAKVAADKDYKVVAPDTGYLIINPLT